MTAVTTDEVFQVEIVLLAWRMGIGIDEIPIEIREMRSTPVSIRRRAAEGTGHGPRAQEVTPQILLADTAQTVVMVCKSVHDQDFRAADGPAATEQRPAVL